MFNFHSVVLGLLAIAVAGCGGGTGTTPSSDLSKQAPEQVSNKLAGSGLQANAFLSLQVTTPGYTNRYARHANGEGFTEVVNASSGDTLKKDASWKAVPGLADAGCYSFESVNYPNEFLRHSNSRIIKSVNNNDPLFKSDATWCAGDGLSGTGVSLQSKNYPGRYLRHYAGQLWMSLRGGPLPSDAASSFNEDVSWNIAAAWSGGSGCAAVDWVRGVSYGLGTVVKFTNGQFYKVVNVGANGSDATDPTISTWYWQPTSCGNSGGNGGGNTGGFAVSEALFNQIFPNRIAFYTYQGLMEALSAYPAFARTGSDVVQRQEAAAFLANIDHESLGLRYSREINQANWPLYCSSGNCGGKQYYGRGPMQISWDYNYSAAGQALGIDLLNNPDLVADNATVAWKTAIWFWMTQKAAAPQTPHDAMVSGAGFGATIRAINGGLECNGAGESQRNSRINKYRDITSLLGVPPGNNLGC